MMEPHEIALLFPAIEGSALQELDKDIRERGIEDPITMYEGKVLDGVHRYMIGTKNGKHIPKRELPEGADPVAFCIARNVHRRHLNPSQLALIAEHFANHRKPGRKDDKLSRTRREAAEEVGGCSERAVARARTVRENCDEDVVKVVRNGKTSLNDAQKVASAPREEQKQAAAMVQNGEAKSLVDAMEMAQAEQEKRTKRERKKKNVEETVTTTKDHDDAIHEVPMPALARVRRAREVLERIDTDLASSERVNAVVAAKHWTKPGEFPDEWAGTIWFRADDIDPSLDRESAQALLDAVEEGTVSSVLIETFGSMSSAWAQNALKRSRRVAIGSGDEEPIAILIGDDANVETFERSYAKTGIVLSRTNIDR